MGFDRPGRDRRDPGARDRPDGEGDAYAATDGAGFYESTDGAATWVTSSAGFGVNKTTDGGPTWPQMNTGLLNLVPRKSTARSVPPRR